MNDMVDDVIVSLAPGADHTSPAGGPRKPAHRTGGAGRRASRRSAARALRRLAVPATVTAVVVALVALASLHWDEWQSASTLQATDNAYVEADTARLSARIAGNIRTVPVADFQRVHAGELLLDIVPDDYAARLAEAEAQVAGAQAALDNLGNQKALQQAAILQAEAQQQAAQARLTQAKLERTRQETLLRTGIAGTAQKVEQAVADAESAAAGVAASDAAVESQRRQLDVIRGQTEQRHAELLAAQANLETARLNLSYTRVEAPFDGVVSERQVKPGEYVSVGSSLLSVVPLPNVYIMANYKETQLTHMRPGQSVDVTVDTFPTQRLHGRVAGLSPASGSQFALLPADNASGNFTKVVQRLPVRIVLDAGQPLVERLRPGMSVETRVHVAPEDPAVAGQAENTGHAD